MSQYILGDDGDFTIKNYDEKDTFSNFLPGIAGVWGVPIWAFYVNRGQGIISFGLESKERAITEFLPANKAYSGVTKYGFRTFIKINGNIFYEPFSPIKSSDCQRDMKINSAYFSVSESDPSRGLKINVKYFTLPNESIGALVREVKITNISKSEVNIQLLDGLVRIVPFGAGDWVLKHMSRTLEAWMHTSITKNTALFRLIVSPDDVSKTEYIKGANFNHSFYEENGVKKYSQYIYDPSTVFGYDTSFTCPVEFVKPGFNTPEKQISCGKMPSALNLFNWSINPGQEKTFYSIYGASFKQDEIIKFTSAITERKIKEKDRENSNIVHGIKDNAFCVSGKKEFDKYVGATYLDNVLRGGVPHSFDKENHYYIYSRKHGDLERDYNQFRLLPSYLSEGEANYRDINQNRRMDFFFNSSIGIENICYFLNLIKIDGYNPLVVQGEKLILKKTQAKKIIDKFKIFEDEGLLDLMQKGFHLGEFFVYLEKKDIKVKNRDVIASELLSLSTKTIAARFGEGHWIDHWRYNLELIENYLYFYPDKHAELFMHKGFMFWDDEVRVLPRDMRYCLCGEKVFQGESIAHDKDKACLIASRRENRNTLYTKNAKVYKTTLIEKLLTIILNKAATLDASGIGIEMEAGKPGWCDSLNGLPSLFGSSTCETLELKRANIILKDGLSAVMKNGITEIELNSDVCFFLNGMIKNLREWSVLKAKSKDLIYWQASNDIKEIFREKTFFDISDETKKVKITVIMDFIDTCIKRLDSAIAKAKDPVTGTCFTYFKSEVVNYKIEKNKIIPKEFKASPLPLFLEGPVSALRVNKDKADYVAVRKSMLFDKKLKMYKLNCSLKDEPLEIGRSRIFVPGWLENESIWLHMEYKYLLETIKAGFYKEFFRDLQDMAVCFFDPDRYGRNILENSSFIVSSAYPDKSIWAKGFVARLSGATAELLNIWGIMCLGHKPFTVNSNGLLTMEFNPVLQSDFFTDKEKIVCIDGKDFQIAKNTFTFKLFSKTLIVYHNPNRKDTFKNCKTTRIVTNIDGAQYVTDSFCIKGTLAQRVRSGEA
ncbi:MAG: hypothetical protein PHC58_06270, partial [Candidatus Omnitrophica bacterium]|nr:hypothetical protein [Candidatus Omnitrophota bacterium]